MFSFVHTNQINGKAKQSISSPNGSNEQKKGKKKNEGQYSLTLLGQMHV
jgi:hypothetical protein